MKWNKYTIETTTAAEDYMIALMYLGRVGGLTLIYAAVSSKKSGNAKLPQERIMIG